MSLGAAEKRVKRWVGTRPGSCTIGYPLSSGSESVDSINCRLKIFEKICICNVYEQTFHPCYFSLNNTA
jgi:hypothetical protein